MTDWKPGDVAMVRGDVALVTTDGINNYAHYVETATGRTLLLSEVTDVRPLVVLDAESAEDVGRLTRAFLANCTEDNDDPTAMQAALRSLVAPPKPEEPRGIGAVVEDRYGVLWVRAPKDGNSGGSEWVSHHSTCHTWTAVEAVRVISEGVTP